MIIQSNARLVSLFKSFSESSAIAIFLVGFLVLMGWILDIPTLKNFNISLVTMKANAAISFILIGISLWLLQTKRINLWMQRIAQGCAFVVALIGLLTLLEYIFGWDTGIDQLLFEEPSTVSGIFSPGRMSPNSALNFLLIGIALILLDVKVRGSHLPTQFLTIIAFLISFLAIMGYIYGAKPLFGIASYTQIALNTSTTFIILCIGILSTRPDRSLMAIFTSENAGGILARRLLFAAIFMPPFLGWLRLLGQRIELYDTEFGLSIVVVVNVIIFAALIWQSATSLDRKDAERKQSEEALRKQRDRLEHLTIQLTASNKELEAFCYSVSHDLRAPLRSIDGFSKAVMEDYHDKLDAQGKNYLQRVSAASQRMGQLIDDLLNLSRITRSEIRRKTVDLSAMVKTIVTEFQEKQPERQVEFVIAKGLIVNGDPQLLRIALENLLSNAWKFTQKHPRASIKFGVTTHNEKPAYFVRDNGVGFDMAYLNKLFGAFQRLHSTTEFEGTGIGLATVQRIIHRHGGHIWAEGVVDQGATFYFTLT